jgi:hypothetical protein
MDEWEWLECDDPWVMLKVVADKLMERKIRLFAVACCRSVWHLLTDDRSRQAIEVAERFADGDATESERASAWEAAGAVSTAKHGGDLRNPGWHNAHSAAWYVAEAGVPAPAAWSVGEASVRAVLLRDLFGNPFRPVAIDTAWRTPAVLALARAVYDNRTLPAGSLDPDRLAVLADALEEAGCTDADILGHLRGPGPHVRGCFVIDTLLDKS